MKRIVRKSVVLIVCALAQEAASSEYAKNYENVDISRWKCFLCEFETYHGTTGELSVASVLTTDDADRFGRNGSFERAGTRAVLNAKLGVNKSSGWMVRTSAANIGLDSSDIAIEVKHPRSLEAKFRFQQYRRLTDSDALTPFRETNGRLTLGSDWQGDWQTSGFTNLATTNRHVELATTRRLLESLVSVDVLPRVNLSLVHRSASKQGVQETFRDGFHQATGLPKIIDHEAVTNRIQLAYRDRRLNSAWSRSYSTFKNLEPLLRWENPYQVGLAQNESANAFSHEHISETIDIRVALPRNSMLRLHERRGETETDPQSLRYGLSRFLDDVAPVELFAKRDYLSQRLVIATQLRRDVELSASRLRYELKDHRPFEELTPALGGLFLGPSSTLRSGDIERHESNIGLNYRPVSGMRVVSRIWRSSLTRTHQEIDQNETRGVEMKLTQPLHRRWETFATLRRESRNASKFQDISANNPYTRRFHQSVQKNRVWSTGLRYSPQDRNDFISLAIDRERRDYPESVLGLSDTDMRGLTLAYGLQLRERINTDGFIASHRQSTAIKGSESLDLSMPWTYSSDDVVNSAGLKLSFKPFNRFVDNIHVDYTLSDGQAKLGTLFADSMTFFPNQVSRHESIDVELGFGEIYGLTVEARVYFEKHDARDWSFDNVDQTTLASVLTMARDNPSYDNTLISLSFNRSF